MIKICRVLQIGLVVIIIASVIVSADRRLHFYAYVLDVLVT